MATTAIRTLVIYATLIAAMRLMGRRQLGELQPVEFVITLLISDLAAVPMQDTGVPLLNGLIPIAVLVSAEILLSALMLKSHRFSSWISGTPQIVIRDGIPDRAILKKLRMTVEDLSESLRRQDVFDFRDVQIAIAETNGTLTVYPVAAKRPTVYEDLARLPPQNHGVPLVVLSDGALCDWAIRACGVTAQWMDRVLRAEGYRREDVMLMTVNGCKEYHIIPKEAVV